MKVNLLNAYFILFFSSFSSYSSADYGENVSIYNIADGALVYSYSSTSNSYVSADYGYELKGNWKETANWMTYYTNDGHLMFQNVYSNLCLAFYGHGYQAVEVNCNENDGYQKIKPQLTNTGAVQLTFPFVSGSTCLYNYAGNENFYVYTNTCSTNKEYLWSLVPVLSDASN